MNAKDAKRNPSRELASALVAIAAAAALAMSASAASAAPFEITGFDGNVLQENGDTATQAASHPATASTSFFLSTAIASSGLEYSTGALKDATVDLPPGLVGNPQVVGSCTQAQLLSLEAKDCPLDSQVGVVVIWKNGSFGTPGHPGPGYYPVFNMDPPAGTLALFGFNVGSATVHVAAKVRSGGDYGVTAYSTNAPTTFPLAGVTFTFWGVPADPVWDPIRGGCMDGNTGQPFTSPPPKCPASVDLPERPFLTLPSACAGPQRTDLTTTSWEGGSDSASFLSHDNATPVPNPIGTEGCDKVPFEPTIEAQPTTNRGDSPSGLDVAIRIPSGGLLDPDATAQSDLKKATVTLPRGLAVNPSSADGLGACAPTQIDLKGTGPAQCPDSSKLGSVEVDTPLLGHTLPGTIYLATPHENPFNSLLALYIAIEDPATGLIVKLAGQVSPDPVTGQLSTTFDENPQVPFSELRVHLFPGARASLRTPTACGTYATTTEMVPWSAPQGQSATPSGSFAIEAPAGAGPCPASEATAPHSPTFDAGTLDPTAGAYSPFVLNLARADGSQPIAAIEATLPKGLVGKLAGISFCPEAALAAAAARSGKAEQAAPSCPAASEVGSTIAAAGAGPTPYRAPGKAYLTGPYKNAPLSMAIVTPAVAGPFDLGNVVVRTALYVDPESAQVHAVSDPIPALLQGIPLDLRSIALRLDRPGFTLNPTSCAPKAVLASALSGFGQPAPLTSPFQVGACADLAFKPKLSLRLKGATRRGGHPALTATLTYPQGAYANTASASVALPHSEFLEQGHIRTICTRVQFAAKQCPAGSVYGRAKAWTPLLDQSLEGPVYLRSSSNPLPDLVMSLHGPPSLPIEVNAVGRIDSVRGGIRTRFEAIPDAPLSKVVLEMQGARKGLLVNSRDICAQANRASVAFAAQNGRSAESRPALKADCGKQSKHKRKQHKSHERG